MKRSYISVLWKNEQITRRRLHWKKGSIKIISKKYRNHFVAFLDELWENKLMWPKWKIDLILRKSFVSAMCYKLWSLSRHINSYTIGNFCSWNDFEKFSKCGPEAKFLTRNWKNLRINLYIKYSTQFYSASL